MVKKERKLVRMHNCKGVMDAIFFACKDLFWLYDGIQGYQLPGSYSDLKM